jgi:hypothetical protein
VRPIFGHKPANEQCVPVGPQSKVVKHASSVVGWGFRSVGNQLGFAVVLLTVVLLDYLGVSDEHAVTVRRHPLAPS